MTREAAPAVYTTAPHSPWREILKHRWSGRRDRALVLETRGGAYRVLGSRRRQDRVETVLASLSATREPVAGESAAAVRRLGGYERAFHVQLTERSDVLPVGLPTSYGAEPVDAHVLWWVHDPAEVVRSRTANGWNAVRRDLERRLHHLEEAHAAQGHSVGAPEMMHHLAAPHALEDSGITYRVTDVCARDRGEEFLFGRQADGGTPYTWSSVRKEEYDFCLQAVRSGPVSLAALWLLTQPDQVSDVLNWVAGNSNLLREETTWQDEMAGLLGKLTEEEQTELSRLLRDRLAALGRPVPGQGPLRADIPQPPAGLNGRPSEMPKGWPL
ncbi:hypothetical protein [Streptomyces violens]|uniref:hypothetical protein n=1 Tax=Streptomyces violens TaxID=66377 RepID=UPI00099609C0|nr:hypothetical protein [Streptomyces violens]